MSARLMSSRPMSARQQLARLLPLGLLILLAAAGLRGQVARLGWDGPLTADGLVIGVALEIVLGTLIVITLVREAAARRAGETAPFSAHSGITGHSGITAQTGTDVPGALRRVLRWVLTGGMIAVAVAMVSLLHVHGQARPTGTPPPRSLPTQRMPARPASPSSFRLPLETILEILLVIVLLMAIAVSVWWAARLRQAVERVPPEAIAEDPEDLREAVESGLAALAELDDARAAIIACYAAMERSLADRGAARGAAGTPDELLRRATDTGVVRGQSAGHLTRLFYEARFSSHPLGPEQRDAAREALDELAAELSGRAITASSPGGPPNGVSSPDGPGS